MSFKVPEAFRVTSGKMRSDTRSGNNGRFEIPCKIKNRIRVLNIIASDGAGWEHVSVSMPDRCPTWNQMCFIKELFWDENDAVIQIHPPQSDYVNYHPYCLHLWRGFDTNEFFTMPESFLVGPLPLKIDLNI